MANDPYFRLRVPEELKNQIERAAVANNRSMTSEILSRLQSSFKDGDRLEDLRQRMEALEAAMVEFKKT